MKVEINSIHAVMHVIMVSRFLFVASLYLIGHALFMGLPLLFMVLMCFVKVYQEKNVVLVYSNIIYTLLVGNNDEFAVLSLDVKVKPVFVAPSSADLTSSLFWLAHRFLAAAVVVVAAGVKAEAEADAQPDALHSGFPGPGPGR